MISITVTQQVENGKAKVVTADSASTFSPFVADTVTTSSDTMVVTDTVVGTQSATLVIPGENNQGGSEITIAWIGVGIVLVIGVMAWKLISDLKKKVTLLSNKVNSLTDESLLLKTYLQESNVGMTSLSARISNAESMISELQDLCRRSALSEASAYVNSNIHRKDQMSSPSSQIRYATLRMPDELGVLRFSERSMSEEPSEQKMFILELDPISGTGTYKINPKAMSTILQDLDVFKNFVKPFSITGSITGATVIDKVVGRIVKNGQYWVVEQPLEITLVK
ncbi:MAG: hypothetical protein HDS13_08030 [Bacteroides sp.]|nr:hypothetical protein [Bacteroides sp.]